VIVGIGTQIGHGDVLDLLAANAVLLLHAVATVIMLGVILTCQFVHYPLFARVGRDSFEQYEREHMRRITLIVGPAMAIELATALYLAVRPPAGLVNAGATSLVYVGLGLVLVNWLSTLTMQGPMHTRLARVGYDERLIDTLVRTNWVRTAAWGTRGVLVAIMLVIAAGFGEAGAG
jgi:hypothetical protein